ncbi:ATP-binding cassette domain-containing protein [Cohnella rhizosphaerae]|uniref:ATP-binding cassette domain-containing protein n=1 Tax=Cohnella rhizosphaerae TaxID=1457232 RepID=A0A9X4L2B4_9BACL|nr:ATP-binding cassette domain-containing protein [Cohnella rhizosphaerae]MDG0812242.1 ATP-binding cassette domain-containing protein [Cohnella rhizosphaerae]
MDVPERQPLLSVRGVERSFDVGGQKLRVLKGINLTLEPNQLIMLKGRSGSGKTTLMNLMGGPRQADRGRDFFSRQAVSPMERRQADGDPPQGYRLYFPGLRPYALVIRLRERRTVDANGQKSRAANGSPG